MATTNAPACEEIDENTFHDHYRPTRSDEGLLEFEDVKDQPREHVWTVVEGEEPDTDDEGDDDEPRPSRANWYALPGFHVVNKLGYLLTEVPWPHENLQAVYFDGAGFD